MWSGPEGMLALCPLPSTDVFQLQAPIAPNQTPGTTLEEIQQTVDARTGRTDIRLSAPSWVSLWRANVRMVDRYRAGRVFLAGDAAHCHSPAGGQGMNTGIQDAFNLSWKLASVLGGADAALLDTYEEERLPIARDVLELSNALMQATVAAGSFAFRRDDRTAQLSLNYRTASLTRELRPGGDGLRAGDRAPQAPGLVGPQGPCSLFDLLRGSHATVLGFGARWKPLLDACEARFGERLSAHAIVAEADGRAGVVDQQGHARAAYGEDVLFVVRPDNYIGLATASLDEKPVLDYLQAILPASA
jgi:FAD binding domain